jgi:hypothetical protein
VFPAVNAKELTDFDLKFIKRVRFFLIFTYMLYNEEAAIHSCIKLFIIRLTKKQNTFFSFHDYLCFYLSLLSE